MSLYPWRAGEVITAEKLRSGFQSGLVALAFSDSDRIDPPGPGNNYAQFADYVHVSSVDVVFDVPFTTIPVIQLTARTGFPGVFIEVSYTDVTTQGFTIVGMRRSTATTNIDWLAIGEPDL